MTSSMRPVLVIGMIVLSVATFSGVSEWRAAHAKEIIPWRDDLAAAQAESRQTGRPIFAYFTASWCPPCQKMKSTTWADNTVKEAMQKFVPVKIDVDSQPEPTARYQVRAMPTYLILSDSGQEQRRREGLMLPEDMVRWLEK